MYGQFHKQLSLLFLILTRIFFGIYFFNQYTEGTPAKSREKFLPPLHTHTRIASRRMHAWKAQKLDVWKWVRVKKRPRPRRSNRKVTRKRGRNFPVARERVSFQFEVRLTWSINWETEFQKGLIFTPLSVRKIFSGQTLLVYVTSLWKKKPWTRVKCEYTEY